jgi:hypothetical protein
MCLTVTLVTASGNFCASVWRLVYLRRAQWTNRATKSGWRMMTLLVQFLGYRHEGS